MLVVDEDNWQDLQVSIAELPSNENHSVYLARISIEMNREDL